MIFFIVPQAFTLKFFCFWFTINIKIVELMEKKIFSRKSLILNKTILLA